jgi:hypothetical protein
MSSKLKDDNIDFLFRAILELEMIAMIFLKIYAQFRNSKQSVKE